VSRPITSKAEAATPIDEYVGATAITRLPAAVTVIDSTIAYRRPLRSASRPKKSPPNGRTTKPTAKTTKVDSTADDGSALLKNWSAKNGANTA
jgi:hypothetical protein